MACCRNYIGRFSLGGHGGEDVCTDEEALRSRDASDGHAMGSADKWAKGAVDKWFLLIA